MRRQRLLLFTVVALLGAPGPAAYALIDPRLQPPQLFERYRTVAVLRVTGIDGEAATLRLDVQRVVKGTLAAKRIRLRAEGRSAREAFNEMVEPNQVIVAYVGKTRQRGAEEVTFYVRSGRWGIGQVAGDGDPQPWRWTEDLGVDGPRSMFGTFNGSSDRLAEMMQDAADGRAFFPAGAFTRFKPDRAVGRLSGTVSGVALYDLDGDGDLDVYACSTGGDRLFLQTAPLRFTDATADRGLGGARSPSVSVGDVNGDGRPDLLLGGTIRLAAERGYATSPLLPAEAARDVKCAAFVEVNGDGWPDVIVSRVNGGLRIYLHPGKAGAPYTDAAARSGLGEIEDCRGGNGFFFTGDWNRDGRADLFYSVGKGLLLVQDRAGRFAQVPSRLRFDFTTGGKAEGRTGAGGMAGLWRPDSTDLIFAFEGSVNFVINEADKPVDATGFANEITEGELGLLGALAEDLNADGYVDVYALNGAGNPNVLYLNRGYGSFMTPHKYQNDLFPGSAHSRGAWSAAAGDLDGDGANDLVLGGTDGSVTVILNDSLGMRRRAEHPTSQQRILDRTALLAVTVRGRRGVCGAEVLLADGAGRVVGRRVLGAQMVTGSCGPAAVQFAARQPGRHTLTVRYADGLTREQPVDLSQPGRRVQVAIARAEPEKGKER